MPHLPFREICVQRLFAAFGDGTVMPSPEGKLYRWILKAESGDVIRLTLDSPEFPDLAHLVISDTKAVPRVNSVTMRTEEELTTVIKQIQERLAR